MQDLMLKLENAAGRRILVVGDLMLDKFIYGDVDRISPESPVPVLAVSREERMPGGAGNVLTNLSSLGLVPVIFALVGDDAEGRDLLKIVKSYKAEPCLLIDDSRPTAIKTRYLARNQHLLRVDNEKTHTMSAELEKTMLGKIEQQTEKAAAIVLSDYGKGVLTPTLISSVIALAKARGVPVLVDPKGRDYSVYRGADYVTPNRKELAEATSSNALKSDDDIVAAAKALVAKSGIGCVIATRSEDGMSVIGKDFEPLHLRAKVREVFDVSGAGDTVIAVLAAMLASGSDITKAAQIANLAAGIAVSKVGTTPVHIDELRSAVAANSLSGRQAPQILPDAAHAQIKEWKSQGFKVGFTNGCFDILHKGHVNYLEQARSQCDRLIVGLNNDASVRILKGPTRPVNDERSRSAVLGSLSSVDMVVFFGATKQGEDNTACDVIDALRPDIFFKGGDYKIEDVPEARTVLSYNGEVAIMGLEEGFSTTNIIAKSAQGAK